MIKTREKITYVQRKLANQEKGCRQSQSYHNHPKDQRFEGPAKALGWILHQLCHPEQPTKSKKNIAAKRFETRIGESWNTLGIQNLELKILVG